MPLFKNWSEICKLAQDHHLLMLEIATLDLTHEDPVIVQLVAAFPSCFSAEQATGPVPLSLIRAEAQKNALAKYRDKGNNAAERPCMFDAVPEHIPVQSFQGPGGSKCGLDEAPMLPSNINPDVRQGELVTWEGRDFVVLENNDGCNEYFIAPAECIAINL